jgi:hypothetical protein
MYSPLRERLRISVVVKSTSLNSRLTLYRWFNLTAMLPLFSQHPDLISAELHCFSTTDSALRSLWNIGFISGRPREQWLGVFTATSSRGVRTSSEMRIDYIWKWKHAFSSLLLPNRRPEYKRQKINPRAVAYPGFFSGGGGFQPRNFFRGVVQQTQLRTERTGIWGR